MIKHANGVAQPQVSLVFKALFDFYSSWATGLFWTLGGRISAKRSPFFAPAL